MRSIPILGGTKIPSSKEDFIEFIIGGNGILFASNFRDISAIFLVNCSSISVISVMYD
jgi:hypothetical protein